MDPSDYLRKIAIERSTKYGTTSEAAYAQVDHMAKSTKEPFITGAPSDPQSPMTKDPELGNPGESDSSAS